MEAEETAHWDAEKEQGPRRKMCEQRESKVREHMHLCTVDSSSQITQTTPQTVDGQHVLKP